MDSRRRRSVASSLWGLTFVGVVGCGQTSLTAPTDASADLSELLPTPACGGAGRISGTTPIGQFDGDVISVEATTGANTTISVTVADSHSGEGITWLTAWMSPDGGADLIPSDGPDVATFIARDYTSSWVVPGTVDVLAATNPAAVSDAGQGGHVEEKVSFSANGFTLSGSLASAYCTVTSVLVTSE